MSIRVNDFQWQPGTNDAEYIKLLESSRDEWERIAQKAISKLKTLSKAQEPRLVIEADFENADEYGFIPAWYEGLVNKEGWWNCIPKEALETAKEDGCRYWTSKPSLKQMEETPWQAT